MLRTLVLWLTATLTTLTPTTTTYTAPLATFTTQPATVTVHTGDTLWSLAATWCHDPHAYPRLAAASHITNPNLIYPGQTITVNCLPAAQPKAPKAGPPAQDWVAPLSGRLVCVSGWGAFRPGHSHKGVDLPRPAGTTIRAIRAGTVTVARYQAGGAGWYVMIDHGAYQTVYMHMLRRPPVRAGQHVTTGQTIGKVGSTGHSSGPHLHFEIHHGAWHPINPGPWLRSHQISLKGC